MSTSEAPAPAGPVRQAVGMAAGVVGSVTVIAFGLYLLHLGVSQNIAGWGTIASLDGLIFFETLRAKRMASTSEEGPDTASIWLTGGYTVGASLVTLVSLYNGRWEWGLIETIETVGVVGILLLRTRLHPRGAIIAGVVVMTLGTIPLAHDYWLNPFFPSWWMWGTGALCDFAALFAARRWSVEDSLFAGVGGILCVIMTILALR